MTKPCDYCGRTDRDCENEAKVIGCDPMPAHEPTPRQRLAEAIQAYDDAFGPEPTRAGAVMLNVSAARAILAELDRRELQSTIDGDMPCS